jgi:ABC-type thiamin/hydroxymethylpyrimidine transport system permease subunit
MCTDLVLFFFNLLVLGDTSTSSPFTWLMWVFVFEIEITFLLILTFLMVHDLEDTYQNR